MRYEDFDLFIEPFGKRYKARVLNSPAGQARNEFSLPFRQAELEKLVQTLDEYRRYARPMNALQYPPAKDAVKDFGSKLFQTIFRNEMLSCLRRSIDLAVQRGGGLRLRLRLTEAPELANIPWEYLHLPSLNRFFALSTETPIVRYLDLPERIQSLEVKPPIKILAMLSSPFGYPPLDVEHEWENLRQALSDLEKRGLVVIERLPEATLNALQRQLRRNEYHIFHFIGHGIFDEQTQEYGLVLEDENSQSRFVSAQLLGMLLHDERTLRLAVLNACEGARHLHTDPFAGTAQRLVQQGIPAVIAMQFEITDEAAITFAREFYSAVADGHPVDAALAEARKGIYAQGNEVEWATPVLYMRSPDGMIFDFAAARDNIKLPAPNATASTPIATERRRLEQKLEALRSEYDLRREKAKRIRAALAIETDVAVKFKLEQQLQIEEAELTRLDQQINEIEQKLK